MSQKKVLIIQIIAYVVIIILVLLGLRIEHYIERKAAIDFAIRYFYLGRGFYYFLFIIDGIVIVKGVRCICFI